MKEIYFFILGGEWRERYFNYMYRNLNAEMSRRNLTREHLAKMLGMSKQTLSNKLNGNANLTLPEVKKIKKILNDISKLDKSINLDKLFEEEFEREEEQKESNLESN